MFLKKEIEILYYLLSEEIAMYEYEEESDYKNTLLVLKKKLEIILKNYEGWNYNGQQETIKS